MYMNTNEIDQSRSCSAKLQHWTWVGIIFPGTSLFAVAGLWAVDITSGFYFASCCSMLMLSVLMAWCQWILYIIRNLYNMWDRSERSLAELIAEVNEVHSLVTVATVRSELLRRYQDPMYILDYGEFDRDD